MAAARGRAKVLPHELNQFVGRARELDRLRRLLTASRLVTVTGPGGMGKTRLALRAAASVVRSFSDGVRLVELADVSSAELLENGVATALGLQATATQPRRSWPSWRTGSCCWSWTTVSRSSRAPRGWRSWFCESAHASASSPPARRKAGQHS
jgi:AAA ATPase domain